MCVYAVEILPVDLQGSRWGKSTWFHPLSSWLSERRSQGWGCHGSVFVFHPVKVLSVPGGDGVWSGAFTTSACVRLCPLSLRPDLCFSDSLLCTAGSLVLHTCSETLFPSFCRPTFWKELRRLAAGDTDQLEELKVWRRGWREKKKKEREGGQRDFHILKSIIRPWH